MASIDTLRRAYGAVLDMAGFGPQEIPYRVAADLPAARLRAYFDQNAMRPGPVLLIIPAPLKRPYIWDLLPRVSVIRLCLGRGFRPYMLEWRTPTRHEDNFGLAEHACELPGAAVSVIEAETGVRAPILAGHSLGGTLAAIFATLCPGRVGGLVLVDAPLAFGVHGGPLAQAVRMLPHARLIRYLAGSPVPGSVLNALSAAAAPDVFLLHRHLDLASSLVDTEAFAIHARMERWSLDEFPLPGQLFEDTIEQLYREDRFLSGRLRIGDRCTGLTNLRTPVMAVIDPAGRVVPPSSVLEGLAAAPHCCAVVLEYQETRGPMLQHLGPLVTPSAHDRLWPRILDWVRCLELNGESTRRAGIPPRAVA